MSPFCTGLNSPASTALICLPLSGASVSGTSEASVHSPGIGSHSSENLAKELLIDIANDKCRRSSFGDWTSLSSSE